MALAATLSACTEIKKTETSEQKNAPVEVVQPEKVGGDRDAHGCIPSAGYQWSELRGACIRLFEDGIRLNAAKGSGMDNTISAFVVFKSMEDDMKAELYLATLGKALELTKTGTKDAGTWKNAEYTLKQYKGMYMLEGKDGKVIYEGAIAPK